ncbi:DUF4309 domain-containing protein [Paenibacillus tuaregi]|uniref:DUF4309 domain-containing protein n=1 Tax=Paenibacillus tuaregi TaxID=1816681 RepID=UPI0008395188|nr:DUF4309 domain-containing protein [Paenibacillus tuaregi]
MKLFARLFIPCLLVFSLALPAVQAVPVQAAGSTIEASKLNKISRLSYPLYDAANNLYTLYIFAKDEKKGKIQEDSYQLGYKKGQTSYTGKYQAALLKSGERYAAVQTVNLGLHTVVPPDKKNYVLKRISKNTPDLFIMTEYGTSNFDLFRSFVVQSGKLQLLTFADKDGKRYDAFWGAGKVGGVRMLPGMKIQTRQYDNSKGKYVFDTFALHLATMTLRRNDSSYGNTSSWNQAGTGDRAYLTELKNSAVKGVLPGNPKVKLGLTAKAVGSVLGKPKVMSNGEWHGYYEYNSTFIGFDDYTHDMNDSSVVTELLLNVEKQNLTVSHVKNWLGKPSEEYVNEEEGNYVVIYSLGKRALVFYSDDEDSFITRASIM